MENKDTFKMTYSAQQQEEIQSIRKKYMPQEADKMELLRALDARPGKKAGKNAITLGVIGALILGCGMSLAMTDFGATLGAAAFGVGVAIGVVGIGVLACVLPIYNRTERREREKIAPEILKLSEELMKP